MDFFEAQERARKRTSRLIVLFVFAVLGTVLAGYVSALMLKRIATQGEGRSQRYVSSSSSQRGSGYWDPKLFFSVTLGTIAVVGLASLFKWSQMRSGGSAVAEMVGGRVVDLKSTNLRERQLLNVVEEMSIASGIPMPAVYVLEQEPGLNAFAAGLTTSDAAVAVTRGTLDKLSRDELQGVIAHEFSHILNGDMRLNVRITATIFGVLVIGLIGRGILSSIRHVRGGGKKGNGVMIALAIGIALMIVGYVGYFFGRLIQAAVSRQREFLADASAVQFTRNPGGITGALRKIGGYALGSKIVDNRSAEIGHFFFSQAFKSNFGGLWATHPPLDQRIRAIDPQWDGKLFQPEQIVNIATESSATAGFGGGQRFSPNETLRRIHEEPPLLPVNRPTVPIPFKPARVVADIGALTSSHFQQAQTLLEAIPNNLHEATRDAATAQILIYGLLLNSDQSAGDRQQALVETHAGADSATALASLRPALSVLDPAARLPLLQLSLPALRGLSGGALDRFVTTLDELVHADQQVTPFEYALQKMLLHQLQLAKKPAQRVQFDSFSTVRLEIAIVLSSLSRLSNADPVASSAAFALGAAQLPLIASQLALLEPAASGLEALDQALDKLAVTSPPIKQRLLIAAAHVISGDGTVTVEEGELFRAIAATLDCPIPLLGSAAA